MTEKTPARTTGLLPSLFSGDPIQSLRREMNDVFSRFSSDWNGGWFGREMIPSLDLSETDNTFELKVDAPGFKADEIEVDVRGDAVHISGERKEETKEEKGKTYLRVERRSGSFSRSLTLPCRVNEQKVAAEYKDGVLSVHLPKVEGARTHKIKVQG